MNDNRRNQLLNIIEREFIGPDPIDWEGLVQENGEEILATDPPRTRYIAGILFPRETTNEDTDLQESEELRMEEDHRKDDEDQGLPPL